MSEEMSKDPIREDTRSGEPAEETQDVILDHNYDGIQEYDNPLPKWWIWTFIGSAIFAALYFFHYQVGIGDGIHDTYRAEVKTFQEAEEKRLLAMGEVSEENLAALVANDASVAKGKAVFQAKCTQCHGAAGEGNIGPNLTDEAWIHGDGSLMSIYDVVRTGVVKKGMPAWEGQLSALDLRVVTAYVGAIRNTNLPGKAPEGSVPTGAKKDAEPPDSPDDAAAPRPEQKGG